MINIAEEFELEMTRPYAEYPLFGDAGATSSVLVIDDNVPQQDLTPTINAQSTTQMVSGHMMYVLKTRLTICIGRHWPEVLGSMSTRLHALGFSF